jgi:hypothetical protein
MARPKTKPELLESARREFQLLLQKVKEVPDDSLAESGVCEDWSVKDILAHLHAWHMLFLTWYQLGMSGEKPAMPAPGYNWKQTPELNQIIFEEYQDQEYDFILDSLRESHQEIIAIIEKHSDQEIFTKKLYKWTGSTSLGSYLVSNTSSHYAWGYDLIRKWLKKNWPDWISRD